MSAQTPTANDHPLKIAWDTYTQTDDFKNSKRWAEFTKTVVDHPHLDGSLWAVFMAGFNAGSGAEDYPLVEVPDLSPDTLRAFSAAMRAADERFQQEGGGTRHYIRDCLWPEMQRRGLAITTSAVGGDREDSPESLLSSLT